MRALFLSLSSLFFLLITAAPAWAQLEISTNGNVGLGITPSSNYKLRVECSSSGCGSSSRRGIYAAATNGSYYNYGVYTVASGTNALVNYGVRTSASGANYNYGIYGRATGGTVNYAVRGYASGGSSNNWAGYFSGNVYTSGSYQSSDARLKKDVRSLRGSNMLAKVLQLEPRRYRYKSAAEAKQQGLPDVGPSEGEHLGLLAQEVEQVFPELVIDVIHPVDDGEEGEPVTTKAINYTELIPVLIGAIQEQQAEIDALKAALQVQERR